MPVVVINPPNPPSAPVVEGLIPLSKSDSRFASNTAGAGGPFTIGSQVNRTWDDSPGYTNGDSVWAWAPLTTHGTFTVSECIIDNREGPRLTGGDSSTLNIITFDQCFINCVGKTGDHADSIQSFPSTGDRGTLNVTNTCIRSYTLTEAVSVYGSGFIESTTIFWADGFQGNVNFSNCLFWGGYRFAIFADPGTTTNVSMTNCYFAPSPEGTALLSIEIQGIGGGTLNITSWTNVFEATIVGGVIVPGDPIPSP